VCVFILYNAIFCTKGKLGFQSSDDIIDTCSTQLSESSIENIVHT